MFFQYLPIPSVFERDEPHYEEETVQSSFEIEEAAVQREKREGRVESVGSKKYACGTIPGLKSLAQLEFKIYQDIMSRLSAGSSYSRSLVEYLNSDQITLALQCRFFVLFVHLLLCRYLVDYEQSSLLLYNKMKGSQKDRVDKLAWHPLCAFRMVRRFEKFLKILVSNGTESSAGFIRGKSLKHTEAHVSSSSLFLC